MYVKFAIRCGSVQGLGIAAVFEYAAGHTLGSYAIGDKDLHHGCACDQRFD